MKGNEISAKVLSSDAEKWLAKLHQTTQIKSYGNLPHYLVKNTTTHLTKIKDVVIAPCR